MYFVSICLIFNINNILGLIIFSKPPMKYIKVTYTASVVAFSKGPRRTEPAPIYKPQVAKRSVN